MYTFVEQLYEPDMLAEANYRWTTGHRTLADYTQVKHNLPGVYKLYRNRRLVTIGQSCDLRKRLRRHVANVRRYFRGREGEWTFRIYPMPGSSEAHRKRKETAVILRNCQLVPAQCRRHREQEIGLF